MVTPYQRWTQSSYAVLWFAPHIIVDGFADEAYMMSARVNPLRHATQWGDLAAHSGFVAVPLLPCIRHSSPATSPNGNQKAIQM